MINRTLLVHIHYIYISNIILNAASSRLEKRKTPYLLLKLSNAAIVDYMAPNGVRTPNPKPYTTDGI
jgi:hypothetical protein